MCTTAQTVASRSATMVVRRTAVRTHMMLLFVGVIIVVAAVVFVPRMRVPGGVHPANLGWMSEQWLAEHRASHPP